MYFFNANAVFLEEIGEEFLPIEQDLVFVNGINDKLLGARVDDFTYERNPLSLAYIPYGVGKYYVRGGVNGGKTQAYLELVEVLKERIEKDLSNGIIAQWHDESHINRYIIDLVEDKDYKILSASYAFPQNFDPFLPYSCKILMRDKNLFGGHDFMRGVVSTDATTVSRARKLLSFLKTKTKQLLKCLIK
ncbi:hypothetical protein CCY97_01460 [Helicobacter sp. 10-6591]|nr:hypothetical protein CCY97_01460 [Helicobacter sp. 10-6591]